jgi:transposase
MIGAQQLDALDPQTRQLVQSLLAQVQQRDAEIAFKQALIDKLTHEMAVLKRLKFAATSERFASTLAPEQKSLLEETLDTDLAEFTQEIERERGQRSDKTEKLAPKRTPLPPHLPRRDVAHEPADTTCGCGQPMQRIGQDVAEKLDYQPGVFTVERHVRGKWACRCCQKLVQAPVPSHVIDKGLPTTGLLAHVLVAKFLDHLPLYRQERIYERAGHLIARSTLAQWVGECGAQLQPLVQALADELRRHVVLHADETPVAMLKPAHLCDGKTHRAYVWSYCTTSTNPIKAVVFEFSETRSGENVREFLKLDTPQAWRGTLITDGFSGYNVGPEQPRNPSRCWLSGRLPMVRVAGLRPNTPRFLANCAEVADGSEVPR